MLTKCLLTVTLNHQVLGRGAKNMSCPHRVIGEDRKVC